MFLPVRRDFERLASCAAECEAYQVAAVIQAKFKLVVHGNEHATPGPGTPEPEQFKRFSFHTSGDCTRPADRLASARAPFDVFPA